MPVSRPPSLSRRVTENCLSGVDCEVPYDGLTHDDLAGGKIADAEGSSWVVSVDTEHDALGPAWRQLVLEFRSLQVSDVHSVDINNLPPEPTTLRVGKTKLNLFC